MIEMTGVSVGGKPRQTGKPREGKLLKLEGQVSVNDTVGEAGKFGSTIY